MNYSSVMHSKKNADYILEEIDAWQWCIDNCTQQKDISDCEGNIFSYMVEYIRFACMQGTAIGTIRDKILKNDPFQGAMKHFGTFWLCEETSKLYTDFMKTPRRVWMKYRLMGVAYYSASRLIRTKIGNIINQRLRYRMELKDYLVE